MGSILDEEEALAFETAVLQHRDMLLDIAGLPSKEWISALNAEHERHFKAVAAILFKMKERQPRSGKSHHN